MITTEQIVASNKAALNNAFAMSNDAFTSVEKLVELNLQVAKAALGEVAENTKAVLSVKDAQELLALQASLLQPSAEKAAAYSRHLYDIATSASAELPAASNKMSSAVDSSPPNRPPPEALCCKGM